MIILTAQLMNILRYKKQSNMSGLIHSFVQVFSVNDSLVVKIYTESIKDTFVKLLI